MIETQFRKRTLGQPIVGHDGMLFNEDRCCGWNEVREVGALR